MSGQPLIYAKDATMYRQQYMDTLNLTSNINDMNLKANQTYKATGQVPPISSMPDNRTTSEKLADIEKLKVSLIADLKPLMGSQMAQEVIQGVIGSPYNTDGALFTFFAQRAPDITKSAMVSYKYGIKGDQTDVRKFVTIVENMYSSAKSITDTAKKFFNTNTGSNYTGATSDEINRMVAAYRTIIQDLHRRVAFPTTEPIGELAVEVERRITAFTNFIDDGAGGHRVTISALGRLSNRIVELQTAGQQVPAVLTQSVHRYLSYVDTFPRIDNIMTFLNKIQNITGIDALAQETLNQRRYIPRSTDNLANIPMITSILQDLISILPPANDINAMVADIHQALNALGVVAGGAVPPAGVPVVVPAPPGLGGVGGIPAPLGGAPPGGVVGGGPAPPGVRVPARGWVADIHHAIAALPAAGRVPVQLGVAGIHDAIAALPAADRVPVPPPGPPPVPRGPRQNVARMGLFAPGGRIVYPSDDEDDDDDVGPVRRRAEWFSGLNAARAGPVFRPAHQPGVIEWGLNPSDDEGDDDGPPRPVRLRAERNRLGRGPVFHPAHQPGVGIGLRRRVGRPKGSGIVKPFTDRLDTSIGIQPMANYISFGKYAINTKRLNDDIISIRHKTGGNILGHPSRKVSPNMAKVFRKIVGNGLPDFEDLSNLTPEERQYLYDVSKKADIISKLNIPAPSKDQQDKDNHSFEVMKGEILSGNDSIELVKKFKSLMLKMSKLGTLPKAQVNELLTDLAELGY